MTRRTLPMRTAARASDGHFAVFYLPKGGKLRVSTKGLNGENLVGHWFNPRHNSAQLMGKFSKQNTMTFSAPHSGRNNDWVLVLDDSSAANRDLAAAIRNSRLKY